jgi:ABC-type anion transport system duplicated permease subunit
LKPYSYTKISFQRWQTRDFTEIFSNIITGIITVVGGAVNASIISEYIAFKGSGAKTLGLGETISETTVLGIYRYF